VDGLGRQIYLRVCGSRLAGGDCATVLWGKRGAAYRSLAEPWADTTHELGEVLAALVGYIARKTREDIRAIRVRQTNLSFASTRLGVSGRQRVGALGGDKEDREMLPPASPMMRAP